MQNETLEAIPVHNFQHTILGGTAFQGHIYMSSQFWSCQQREGGPGLSRQEVDPVSAKQWVNEERAPGRPLVRGERQRSGVIHKGLAAERAMR